MPDMELVTVRALVKAVRDMPRLTEQHFLQQRMPTTLVPSDFTDAWRREVRPDAILTSRVGEPLQVNGEGSTADLKGHKWASHGASEEATTKDYAPIPFLKIRELLGINPADYARSWDLDDSTMTPKTGAGRSGSLFLSSRDGRYIFKLIPHGECSTFIRCLQNYYLHFLENPDCLIACAVALHKITPRGKSPLYMIVFSNVTNTNFLPPNVSKALHKYDLKGRTPKEGKTWRFTGQESSRVMKDNDLDRRFAFEPSQCAMLLRQLEKDIDFLARNNLMDYSILIGVAKRDPQRGDDPEPGPHTGERRSYFRRWHGAMAPTPEGEEVIFVGFIDYLTNYGMKKVIAHTMKRMKFSSESLSTIRAPDYATRMKQFASHIFVPYGCSLHWDPNNFSKFCLDPSKNHLPPPPSPSPSHVLSASNSLADLPTLDEQHRLEDEELRNPTVPSPLTPRVRSGVAPIDESPKRQSKEARGRGSPKGGTAEIILNHKSADLDWQIMEGLLRDPNYDPEFVPAPFTATIDWNDEDTEDDAPYFRGHTSTKHIPLTLAPSPLQSHFYNPDYLREPVEVLDDSLLPIY